MEFLNLQNIIILLGLIVFAYLSWRKIELGIYSIIFFLPLYLVKAETFGIPTTFIEMGIYLLFAIWVIKNYRLGGLKKAANLVLSEPKFALGMFLLLTGVATSTVLSSDLRTSAGILKGWFIDPFLFFAVFISTINSPEKRLNILKIFTASGFAVAIISLAFWIGILSGGVTYDMRLNSFYASPNYLAMYLAIPFIIAAWFSMSFLAGSKVSEREKYFWPVAALFTAIPIYFTYSYAAWLAIAVSIFMVFYLAFPFRKMILLSSLLLLFSALLVFGQAGTSKFENLKSLSYRSSTNSRFMIWRASWLIGKDHPVFGIGPGNFPKYYLDYQKEFSEPYLEWAVPEPHNIFLAFWLQAGALGFAGFILLLIWFFKKGVSLLRKTRASSAGPGLIIILLSLMAYTLVHGLFDTTYWKNDLSIIFWMILGLMLMIKINR